jgi:hypothetical protein
MATSAYHLAVTPHGLKIGPSRYGGSPGGEKYWRVAGSCKPHLLGLTLVQSLPTCTKCLRPRRRSLRQGASSTRALLIRLQGPQAHSCYWLWQRLDRLSASPLEGKVGQIEQIGRVFLSRRASLKYRLSPHPAAHLPCAWGKASACIHRLCFNQKDP